MALTFDKCIFEILAKLGATQLTALCDFIDSKVDILQRELDTALAYTNVYQDQFNELDARFRAAEALFDNMVAASPLLTIAKGLSPNCANLGDVFQGALDAADVTKTVAADILYVARQIKTVNGLIQTAKNEATDAIGALRDLCRIVQLVIIEKAGNFADFIGPRSSSVRSLK